MYVWVEEDVEGLVWFAVNLVVRLDVELVEEGLVGDPPQGIVRWIERTYHRRHRQASLSRLTSIEYETIMDTSATLAT